ncbi:S9 family peptidase [Aquirufa rosea]|uniref:S9 family peptidase n=1 Tax=Aquirufa rosea TaxID=2509241 RepID=A0A4Q1C0B2_9BACT|nr:S9 family peptidase [Aquirufa rosea]RXK49850.1 S9 family peptidase [Aquirufa rosea]
MNKLLSCILLLLLALGNLSAQLPVLKTFNHEAMMSTKRVAPPKISPDGMWVIYSQQIVSYDADGNSSDLWLAATDGSTAPRKITHSKSSEDNYFWHPTENRIFFTAKREGDEASQLYSLDLSLGGEAQRISQFSLGISSPMISRDGSKILFSAKVFPGVFTDSLNKKKAEEKKKLKYNARVYNSFPIRLWDSWLDEKQSHVFVLDLSNKQVKNLFAEISLIQSPGFQLGSFNWAPDQQSVVFTATTELNTTAYQNAISKLYQVSLEGGKEKLLVDDSWDYASVDFSQDGKYLIATGAALDQTKIYHLNRLYRFNWPDMSGKMELIKTLDRPINHMEIGQKEILASVEDQGFDRIIKISIQDGTFQNVLGGKQGSYTQVSMSQKENIFAYQYQSMALPAENFVSFATKEIAISKANDAKLKDYDLKDPEVFWTVSRGRKIRSFLLKPASFDPQKKYPLFVLMHGGPAISIKDAYGYRWNPHVLAGTEYVIVMTDYTGSTGYGEKFAQDIQLDPFRGPGQDILEAAKDAMKRYSFIDGNRQAAGGASYGGHLANWMQASTSHFKCLISHAGLVNSESQWGTSDYIWGRELMNGGAPWVPTKTWKEQNPMRYAAQFKTPILLTVGEKDFRVPLNNTIENWSILQRQKVPSKLIVFPEENHWILKPENSRFHYQEIRNWLATYLK